MERPLGDIFQGNVLASISAPALTKSARIPQKQLFYSVGALSGQMRNFSHLSQYFVREVSQIGFVFHAHELRTPLLSAFTDLELLVDHGEYQGFRIIREEAEHIALINNTGFSRIEAGPGI
jgi:signal transduction histidine kinase